MSNPYSLSRSPKVVKGRDETWKVRLPSGVSLTVLNFRKGATTKGDEGSFARGAQLLKRYVYIKN